MLAAIPDKEFTFRTVRDFINKDSTTWRYTFEPQGDATVVTESYEVHDLPGLFVRIMSALFGQRPSDMAPHMQTSLERIKAILEREAFEAGRDT